MRRRAPVARGAAALAALCALAAGDAAAQSLDGYLESSFVHTAETNQQPAAPTQTTDLDELIIRLNLIYTQPLTPNFSLLVGGFFERTAPQGTVSNIEVDAIEYRLRPFATLRWRTPVWRADLGVDRDQTRTESRLVGQTFEQRLTRDTLSGNIGWFPDSQNYVQLSSARSEEYDEQRLERERELRDVALLAQWQPRPFFRAQYRGSVNNVDDKVEAVETDTQSHNLRLFFNESFLRSRVNVSADYNYNWVRDQVTVRGEGEFEIRLFPIAGLSAIDDFPELDPLLANPGLIDGNRVTPAGIDLGVPPVGGDDSLRNFGVDMGFATRINQFYVWVDREVRAEVAPSLAWEIWTSADNLNWVRQRTIATAPFGPFDNRFTLEFQDVEARYVKVVVAPLDPAVPFASEYPDLFVTELEPFQRVAAADADTETTRWNQLAGFNVRARLTERPLLFYDLSYLRNWTSQDEERWSVINALSLSHPLSRVWSVAARVSDDRGQDSRGADSEVDRVADDVSVSVTAAPTSQLRSTLIGTVRREEFGDDTLDTDTILWNTIATPYRGVDLNISLGGSKQLDGTGRETKSRLFNANAGITPAEWLGFNLLFTDNSRKTRQGDGPYLDDPNRAYEASVTVNPLQTLYLFASYRIEERNPEGRRRLRSYNFSWSPFPYGSLRLGILYNEFYDSQDDTTTRLWGPSLRWNITARSWFDLSYQATTTESTVLTLDRDIYAATLHLGF